MSRPLRFLSDHLLVVLTLAFSLGIATPLLVRMDPHLLVPLRLSGGFLAILLLALNLGGWSRPLPLLLPVLFAVFGLSHGLGHLQPPTDETHLFHRITDRREAIVVGTLLAAPEFDGKLSRVRIASSRLRFPEDPRFVATQGTLLVHLAAPWPATILPGDTVVVRAELKRPDGHRSPGAFDYPRYLALQDILVSGFSRSPLFVHKLEEQQGFWQRLRFASERARSRIGQFLDSAVAEKHRGLYRAILIGDGSAIDDQVRESFTGSGTIHILSISGLHLTIIGTLLYSGLYWLFSRSSRLLALYPLRKWAAFLCLPALLGYGLLAGLNVPVFRAMIMSCVAIIALCSDRPKSPSTLLAIAALIILTIDPLSLALISFQLSFAATAAILFLVPVLKALVGKGLQDEPRSLLLWVGRWALAGVLVSAAATAVTAPLTLHAFNRFSVIGIIANLVVEPLMCLWSLPCGILALALAPLTTDLATILLRLGAPGLTAAVESATFFANLPLASVWRPGPPGWLLFLSGLGFLGIVLGWRKQPRYAIASGLLFVVSLVVMLLPSSWSSPAKISNLKLTVLDVGQGSANLVHFPSGHRVLIDGGGSAMTATSVGERVIAPYLWRRGIGSVDAVIITHPDADHYNGLFFILKHFSPETLWVRDVHGRDEQYRELLQLAERMGVTVRVPMAGEELPGLGPGESLRCLSSPATISPAFPSPVNIDKNNGLVLKACHGQRCTLFPGDIDRREEQRLVGSAIDLSADIILSPHHGSISSNSRKFLAAVAPHYMLVSAGRSGRGHFPHAGLPDDCHALDITLITTPKHGTLEVDLATDKVRISGYGRLGDNPFHPYRLLALPE